MPGWRVGALVAMVMLAFAGGVLWSRASVDYPRVSLGDRCRGTVPVADARAYLESDILTITRSSSPGDPALAEGAAESSELLRCRIVPSAAAVWS